MPSISSPIIGLRRSSGAGLAAGVLFLLGLSTLGSSITGVSLFGVSLGPPPARAASPIADPTTAELPPPRATPRPGASAPSGPQQTGWRAKAAALGTPWTAQVSPGNDYPSYPRPQLTRTAWESLNGVWQFAPAVRGQSPPIAVNLAQRILVPFPMESALSGIQAHSDYSFYRRTFTIPSAWSGRHILLHFGAVDWQARVWVNGRLIGTHAGGYDPFTMDITSALARTGVQTIVVGVWAPVDERGEPIGKQRLAPGRIFYTASSGIWQTPWLEPVPTAHVTGLVTTPDLGTGTLKVAVSTVAARGDTVQAIAYRGSRPVGMVTGAPGATLSLPIPHPRLWSPGDPYLYGLTVRLLRHGRRVDAVGSYFGMRSISVTSLGGVAKVVLNGRPIFMLGTLDQGYWPDGIYTAPTEGALEQDLITEKALGFNTVRKHMKVEPDLWYYDADRLGLLVWQDMPAMKTGPPSAGARAQFTTELHAMVATHIDHPSVVQWDAFNEGWGEFDPAKITAELRRWDPSRLIDTDSGENCCYSFGPDDGSVLDNHSYVGPGIASARGAQATEDGEMGGLGLAAAGHRWPGRPFTYETESSSAVLTQRYADVMTQAGVEARHFGLSAAIDTAATDVEDEIDGLVTYDRAVVKVDPARVLAVNRAVIAAGSRAPAPFGTYPSLAAAYDNVGITDASDPLAGNFDGAGHSFDAGALAADGLAPGRGITIDGVPVTWPDIPAGTPDNVVTGGQTVRIGRAGRRLVLLGAGTWAPSGGESARGTITYADGSVATFRLSFGDWTAATGATGAQSAQIVATSTSNSEPGPGALSGAVHVYADAIRLARAKKVRSITLPAVDDGIVTGAQAALHVFALGVR